MLRSEIGPPKNFEILVGETGHALRALPPPLLGCDKKRMRGSWKESATLRGSSWDPSSTTRISKSWQLWASTDKDDPAQNSQAFRPQPWKVTVSGANAIANVTRMTDFLVSGKAVHYDLKWDQDIEGWTFAAGNPPGIARRLLLELGAIVGNLIPAAIADQWLDNHVLGRMREAGAAQFNTTAPATANETLGLNRPVQQLTTPNVDFGGNWTRIGRYVWVSNSVVDGTNRPVYGQIIAGTRFSAVGENGNRFIGFVLLAGLSFRGGASVVHDPTVTTDIQADLQLPPPAASSYLVVAIVGAVAVVAGLLLLAFLLRRRRRREDLPPPPPPPPEE